LYCLNNMSISTRIYRSVFSKASRVAVVVIVGAFVVQRGTDIFGDSLYDRINYGKQWKDIKHLYGG